MKFRVTENPGAFPAWSAGVLERPLLAAARVAPTIHPQARLAWGGWTLSRGRGGWRSCDCAVGVCDLVPPCLHTSSCMPTGALQPRSRGRALFRRLHRALSQSARKCQLCTLTGAGAVFFTACPQGLEHPSDLTLSWGSQPQRDDLAAYPGWLPVMRCV